MPDLLPSTVFDLSGAQGPLAMPDLCPIHQRPLYQVCMACRGKVGGLSTSKRKVRAVKRNQKLAVKARKAGSRQVPSVV